MILPGVFAIAVAVQAEQAVIAGTVRDRESGEPVAGVIVILSDLNRVAMTDARGGYALSSVPSGPQHLTIRGLGYSSRTLHALVPPEGRLQIEIVLRREPIRLGSLAVHPVFAWRDEREHDPAQVLEARVPIRAVRLHPQTAEADVLHALQSGAVRLGPEASTGVHIRGGASDHTAFVLDGIPVLSPVHAAGLFGALSPDALSSVRVSSAPASPELPDALAGVVTAETREPEFRIGAQGSVSTSHASATVAGPVVGAGYLLSLRSGYPGGVAPRSEPSYVRGELGDALAKLEAPIAGGRVRVLGYESENELDVASRTDVETPRRNVFAWQSRSLGAEWSRPARGASLRVRAWSATLNADARWNGAGARTDLVAKRLDEGLLVSLDRTDSVMATLAGFRLERSRTDYRAGVVDLRGHTAVASAFARHTRPLTRNARIELGGSIGVSTGGVHVSPRVNAIWRPSPAFTTSAVYARLHQFTQSLRNGESVVGRIFPVDLFVGAGAAGIPVARSDLGLLGFELRAGHGLRITGQVYARRFDDVVLVAPVDGTPFATTGFAVGGGMSSGVAIDAEWSHRRFGVVAGWGWQRVRYAAGDTSYVPEHAARHAVEAGMVAFPSPTFSVRLGATGLFGRRATSIAGAFEWESCNLLDQGCEFAGSPEHGGEPLGGAVLPSYARLDVSLRKHWHLDLSGRDAQLGVYGTLTNVFARKNVLTYATDPSSGTVPVELRPLAPLVVGIDWRM